MTELEFKKTLTALGWTYERAMLELGVSLRTIARYAGGETRIPYAVVLVLKAERERRAKRVNA